MEDPYDASRSQTETSVEDIGCSFDSKDSQKPNQHGTDTLKTKAIEVNSADEVRQAIKAVMSGKTPQIQSEETDPVQPSTTESEEIQIGIPNEYKPESGDQLLPKQDKARKRRGRPQKAGPSKRVKRMTVEDFYVGKLSNLVTFPSYKNQRNFESDSDGSMVTPYAPNQWLRMRFYK